MIGVMMLSIYEIKCVYISKMKVVSFSQMSDEGIKRELKKLPSFRAYVPEGSDRFHVGINFRPTRIVDTGIGYKDTLFTADVNGGRYR